MSSSLVRWGAAAAFLGGVLGILLTPFATFAGWLSAPDQTTPPTYPDMPWAQLVEPLVTPFLGFGTYEAVYAIYGKVFLLVYLLFLIGLGSGLLSNLCQKGRESPRSFTLAPHFTCKSPYFCSALDRTRTCDLLCS